MDPDLNRVYQGMTRVRGGSTLATLTAGWRETRNRVDKRKEGRERIEIRRKLDKEASWTTEVQVAQARTELEKVKLYKALSMPLASDVSLSLSV